MHAVARTARRWPEPPSPASQMCGMPMPARPPCRAAASRRRSGVGGVRRRARRARGGRCADRASRTRPASESTITLKNGRSRRIIAHRAEVAVEVGDEPEPVPAGEPGEQRRVRRRGARAMLDEASGDARGGLAASPPSPAPRAGEETDRLVVARRAGRMCRPARRPPRRTRGRSPPIARRGPSARQSSEEACLPGEAVGVQRPAESNSTAAGRRRTRWITASDAPRPWLAT